jgi:predicted transcriptional regulator
MDPPSEDRTADPESEKPDFTALDDPSDVVRTGRTRDQIYTTVLQLDEPTTVADIAERAGPGVDATREYLRWFADMGLVSRTQDTPERYVVNREYLRWRRADRLRKEYDETELVDQLQDVTAELEQYRERFDAGRPDDIVIRDYAADHGEDVAAVWNAICMWETARERRDVISSALEMRRQHSGRPADGSESLDDSELEA